MFNFTNLVWKNDPAILARYETIPLELKQHFYAMGLCQPMPEDLPDKSFPRDSYGRRFTNLWYNAALQDGSKVHRDWLSYSPSTNRAYCLHCMMYGINLHKSTSLLGLKMGLIYG